MAVNEHDLLAEDVNFVWRAKQGLRNCSYGTDGERECFACPYWQSSCEQDLHKDSLGAILHLEQRNRELAGMADSAMREKVQLHETIDQLKVQLEAALGELKRAAGENAVCIGCKHYGVPIEDSPACTECDCECEKCKNPCPCASCERASNWEWNGGNV